MQDFNIWIWSTIYIYTIEAFIYGYFINRLLLVEGNSPWFELEWHFYFLKCFIRLSINGWKREDSKTYYIKDSIRQLSLSPFSIYLPFWRAFIFIFADVSHRRIWPLWLIQRFRERWVTVLFIPSPVPGRSDLSIWRQHRTLSHIHQTTL